MPPLTVTSSPDADGDANSNVVGVTLKAGAPTTIATERDCLTADESSTVIPHDPAPDGVTVTEPAEDKVAGVNVATPVQSGELIVYGAVPPLTAKVCADEVGVTNVNATGVTDNVVPTLTFTMTVCS